MTNGPLVFIDTETTGLHHKRDAWEIAMIRREPDGTEEQHCFQVIGIALANAEPMALKVGGFYERYRHFGDWGHYETTSETDCCPDVAAKRVAQITRGASLVAANPAFDAETLKRLLRKEGFLPAWHYHLIDIEAVAIGWLTAKGETVALPAKSDALSAACGVPTEGRDRHTALGDALWVRDWFDAIMPST